jgi:hypothetical protein
MKYVRKVPEQSPFVVILASHHRRYRNSVLASDAAEARVKADQMAQMLAGDFSVLHVRPARHQGRGGHDRAF